MFLQVKLSDIPTLTSNRIHHQDQQMVACALDMACLLQTQPILRYIFQFTVKKKNLIKCRT